MNKLTALLIASLFAVMLTGAPAYAQDDQAPAAQDAAEPVVQQVSEPAPVEEMPPVRQLTAAEEKQLALEAAAREKLMNKEWGIYLSARDGSAKGVEADSLVFTEETVNSKNLSAAGYPASNYGLFVSPDGVIAWETMKSSSINKKNKAFLRGELRGDVMTGAVFMKPEVGNANTFIYSTVNPGNAPTTTLTTTTATTVETSSGAKKGKKR